ncbi:hypothetical protein ACHAXS_008477 [Conticribra weissflogii]
MHANIRSFPLVVLSLSKSSAFGKILRVQGERMGAPYRSILISLSCSIWFRCETTASPESSPHASKSTTSAVVLSPNTEQTSIFCESMLFSARLDQKDSSAFELSNCDAMKSPRFESKRTVWGSSCDAVSLEVAVSSVFLPPHDKSSDLPGPSDCLPFGDRLGAIGFVLTLPGGTSDNDTFLSSSTLC